MNITFSFQRLLLEEFNVFPEEGDVVRYNGGFYEITSIVENRFIGGQTKRNNKHSVVCRAKSIQRSKLNIEEY